MKLVSSKIFAGYLLVIALLTGLILLFSFQTLREQYVESSVTHLKNINYSLHQQIVEYFQFNTLDKLDNKIKSIGSVINTRITVVDSNGKVIADSQNNPETMENHKERPEIREALSNKFGRASRFSKTVNDEMLYVALPINDGGKNYGAIRTSMYLSEINRTTQQMTWVILQSALIAIGLAIIAVVFFSRSISKPINMLSVASRRVAAGNFDVKVKLKGRDEIRELADNFNNMTSRIKDLFSEVTRQKDELNTLIKTIQEGLVAFNTNGKVILANKAFCDIAGLNELHDTYYWEIIPETKFDEVFKSIVSSKESFTTDITIGAKHFLCSANFIESKKEAVFLFHDITDIKKLEKVKRDFAINVSHELRTPLTAIKGFIETLEDELEGEHARYVEIIKRHTNRLINIVQDLLILAEVEEPQTKLVQSSTNIKILLDNVIKIFEQKLIEKNLELEFLIPDNFPELNLDTFRMEQVFINLIDNAIKYTDFGKITLEVKQNMGFAIINVSDTGVGIPKEDTSRIFERFYTVDKSRSRKVGGTGLGLSIVKHIILQHKGDISINSATGKGTTFSIKLPI